MHVSFHGNHFLVLTNVASNYFKLNGLSSWVRVTLRCHDLDEASYWGDLDLGKDRRIGMLANSLSKDNIRRSLIFCQVKRWWNTTHTFHMSNHKLTMNPHNLHLLIGLRFASPPLGLRIYLIGLGRIRSTCLRQINK